MATWGDQTCQRFEATAVGFETGFSRLRVRPSNRFAIAPHYFTAISFMGDSIVRKTGTAFTKGDDVVVCFLGTKVEVITPRVDTIMGSEKGEYILVHVGINNAEREGGREGGREGETEGGGREKEKGRER